MFETGSGNVDLVRMLRRVPGASAHSLTTAVYRLLPNDSDLSELFVLRRPALNLGFADGVARYHTSQDDIAHLHIGSLQHYGVQALSLARWLAEGPLPRPPTGDAVFFTLPGVGLVAYPEPLDYGVAVPVKGNPFDREIESMFRQMAQMTGGRAFFPNRIEELPDVYSQLRDELFGARRCLDNLRAGEGPTFLDERTSEAWKSG
jgi:hypothetical protein